MYVMNATFSGAFVDLGFSSTEVFTWKRRSSSALIWTTLWLVRHD